MVPFGTGMDFARSHGIPRKLDAAVDVALDGQTTHDRRRPRLATAAWEGADAEAYFANIASAGMSGAVARQANRTTKALGGRVSFFAALVRVFAGWRNTELDVDVGGERRSGKMTNLIVANGRYQGGGMLIAPEAVADDGLFDILVIGDVTKRDFVAQRRRRSTGGRTFAPEDRAAARRATASVDGAVPVPVELDGEQPGTTPATFEVVPGALRLRVPARSWSRELGRARRRARARRSRRLPDASSTSCFLAVGRVREREARAAALERLDPLLEVLDPLLQLLEAAHALFAARPCARAACARSR